MRNRATHAGRRDAGVRLVPVTAALFGISACGGGERQIAGPSDPGGGSSAITLTVHVRLEGSEAGVAAALGWEGGVPGADVHLNRSGTATFNVAMTGETGDAVFDNLVPGRYRVFAGRRLTTSEAEMSSGLIEAFGDGRTLDVTTSQVLELGMAGQQAPSLVISEINRETPPSNEVGGGSYFDGVFLEVYNNSGQVEYLDGLLFGVAYVHGYQDYDHTPCSFSQSIRQDASGIYARWFLRFPGDGATFPLQPGETALIAQSAVDHTPVHPDLTDLSHADFEIRATRNADNPAVPNMIDVGFDPLHPSMLLATSHLYFLAEPSDPQTAPIAFRDVAGRGYVKIPQAEVIDAAGFFGLNPDQDAEAPPCIPFAAPIFERYEGHLADLFTDYLGSLQRRFLRREGGRSILQNSNTSAVDFAFGTPTPGMIP